MKINIGFSTCPNDTFIFDALINNHIDNQDIEFDSYLADVEELNKLSQKGKLAVSKISFANYPRIADKYVILNAGAALGNNNGPLLISKKEISTNQLAQCKVAIPGINTTANLLLSIAFPQIINKTEVLFSEIENSLLNDKYDAGLIIHESRFTYQSKGLQKIVDLGQYWEQQYGQLIPLGCIVARRDLGAETIQKISNLISQSVQFAYANPAVSKPYIKQHAQEMADEVAQQHIGLYVNEYSINLGNKGRDAIRFLFNKGYELGILPQVPNSIFID